MSIGTEEIRQVVESVWSAVLSEEIRFEPEPLPPHLDADSRTAFIQINGAWDGVVVCRSESGLLRSIAAIMFGLERHAVTEDLIHDAFGEIANMIAGNLKALLDGECFLGLPAVVSGSDYSVIVNGARCVAKLEFASFGRPVAVELLQVDVARRARDPRIAAVARG